MSQRLDCYSFCGYSGHHKCNKDHCITFNHSNCMNSYLSSMHGWDLMELKIWLNFLHHNYWSELGEGVLG